MMNENTNGFNAPSRRAIYNRIMEDGTGNTPTYENFLTFDQQHRSLLSRGSVSTEKRIPFARPRFVGKSISASE